MNSYFKDHRVKIVCRVKR